MPVRLPRRLTGTAGAARRVADGAGVDFPSPEASIPSPARFIERVRRRRGIQAFSSPAVCCEAKENFCRAAISLAGGRLPLRHAPHRFRMPPDRPSAAHCNPFRPVVKEHHVFCRNLSSLSSFPCLPRRTLLAFLSLSLLSSYGIRCSDACAHASRTCLVERQRVP